MMTNRDWLLNTVLSLDNLAEEMKQCERVSYLKVLAARLRECAILAEQLADAVEHDANRFIMPNASERVQ